MASTQQTIVTSKLDSEFQRLLNCWENRSSDLEEKLNIRACQTLAKNRGFPRPGWVIWAVESKARLNRWGTYLEELGPRGKIGSSYSKRYLFAMAAAREPDGNCYIRAEEDSSKSGSTGSTSQRAAVVPTTLPDIATNEQMVQVAIYEDFERCVNDKKRSTVMHKMYAKIRLSTRCGGNPNDRGYNITIANDTSSSVQIIEERVWEACIKDKNVPRGAEVLGPIITGNSPGKGPLEQGPPQCRTYVPTEIQLFADEARTKPLTPWFEEQSCAVPDAPKGQEPHYLSGRSLRKNLIFASPKGNHCLIVGTDQQAVASALAKAKPKEEKTKAAKATGA